MDEAQLIKAQSWRRALVLTGEPVTAQWVLERVCVAQPDLLRLTQHQIDRLLVQQSRQAPAPVDADSSAENASGPSDDSLDAHTRQLAEALRGLSGQEREAWVFRDLLEYDEIAAARAMDCSRTAMTRFRDQAQRRMVQLIEGDYLVALQGLRHAMEHADAEPSLRAVDERLVRALSRRRRMNILKFAAFFLIMAVVGWTGYDLLHTPDAQDVLRERLHQKFTNPPPPTAEDQERSESLLQQEQAPAAGQELKRPE